MVVAVVLASVSCRNSSNRETPTRGNVIILTDATIYPHIEGQANVFESRYRHAQLNVVPASEQEISEKLKDEADSLRLAVLLRRLTPSEEAAFEVKRIRPRITEVAYDGIAVIANLDNEDSTISTETMRTLLRGGIENRVVVFDSPTSGIIREVKEFTGVDTLAQVYALNSNPEVIEYVAANGSAIGFVGVSWLYEADSLGRQYSTRVRILAVGDDETGFYMPTQNDLAEMKYPLTRKIYFLNLQGNSGLGLGFASFLASDVGQRIVLADGLVPVTFPKREVVIRKQL